MINIVPPEEAAEQLRSTAPAHVGLPRLPAHDLPV